MANENSVSIVSKVWNYPPSPRLRRAGSEMTELGCDLRTNQHFTLKTNPLATKDLTDFIKVYKPPTRARRKETDRFKKFTYDEIVARDKANLDIFWLKDESLEDTENLPPPAELAADIIASLENALEEFRGVEDALIQRKE